MALFDSAEQAGRLRVLRPQQGESCFHIFGLLVEPSQRPALLEALAAAEIGAASHFVPLHSSPYAKSRYPACELPTTDHLAASIVRLPIYPDLTEAEQDQIVHAVLQQL